MKFPLVVIIENVRSAYNVGSIFRTSDGAGVGKIFLTGYTPHPPHNRIPKTALGAIEHVEWEYRKNTEEVVKELKNTGYEIVSAEIADNAIKYNEVKYTKPTAIIFGNEIEGVSKETLELSDKIVFIPMHGVKESLNVAVSFGIIVYDASSKISKNIG